MKKIILLVLSIFLISSLFAVQKNEQFKVNSKIIVTGYVVSKGNVPFVYPAIRTQDGTEYMIICKDKTKEKLLDTQGYLIKFTGKINEDGFFVLKKWKKIKKID